MSLLTVIRLLVNRGRGKRAQTPGDDTRASSATSESDMQCIVERADRFERTELSAPPGSEAAFVDDMREQQRDNPPIEARQTVFGTSVHFSDGATPGSWIIAEDDAVIDWRDL